MSSCHSVSADPLTQGFSTRGPWPPGGPRRHCRGSATWAYVDQFTIDFFYFYKYTWARRHIYVWIAKSHCPKYWCRPIFSEEITLTSIIGRICVRGEGAWRRLQTWKRRVRDCKMFWESLAHQWAADYFLVRMVVPGTKPVENPWCKWLWTTNNEKHTFITCIMPCALISCVFTLSTCMSYRLQFLRLYVVYFTIENKSCDILSGMQFFFVNLTNLSGTLERRGFL